MKVLNVGLHMKSQAKEKKVTADSYRTLYKHGINIYDYFETSVILVNDFYRCNRCMLFSRKPRKMTVERQLVCMCRLRAYTH